MEVGRVQKQVQRDLTPPHPHLSIAFQQVSVFRGHPYLARQRFQHPLPVAGWDQQIDVDVDGSAGTLRAPGEGQRAAESVGCDPAPNGFGAVCR